MFNVKKEVINTRLNASFCLLVVNESDYLLAL